MLLLLLPRRAPPLGLLLLKVPHQLLPFPQQLLPLDVPHQLLLLLGVLGGGTCAL